MTVALFWVYYIIYLLIKSAANPFLLFCFILLSFIIIGYEYKNFAHSSKSLIFQNLIALLIAIFYGGEIYVKYLEPESTTEPFQIYETSLNNSELPAPKQNKQLLLKKSAASKKKYTTRFNSNQPEKIFFADNRIYGKITNTSLKSFVLEIKTIQTGDKGVSHIKSKKVRVYFPRHGLESGDHTELGCAHIMENKADNLFQQLELLQGVLFSCRDPVVLRINKRDSLLASYQHTVLSLLYKRLERFPEDSFAQGFLLADTSTINPVDLKLLRKMGVAHLFSASGLHLGLIYGFIAFICSILKIDRFTPFIVMPVAFFYTALLDFRISILRALLFLLLLTLLKLLKRKNSSFHTLFHTATIIELIFPLSSFSPSFMLSFGITLSIIIFYPVYTKIFTLKNSYLKTHSAITLSAYTGSIFFSWYIFEYVNPLSLIYNFFLVPLSAFYLGTILAALFFDFPLIMVQFIDSIIQKTALFHYTVFDHLFPSLNHQITSLWLFLMFIIFASLLFFYHRNYLWTIRKHFAAIVAWTSLLFFINLLFTKYPTETIFVYPYGVVYYHKGKMIISGERAPFIKEDKLKIHLPEIPVSSVHAEPQHAEFIYTSLLPNDFIYLPIERKQKVEQVIKLEKQSCLLFGKKVYNNLYLLEKYDCRKIFVALSKKDPVEKTVKEIRKNINVLSVHPISYFRWNEITPIKQLPDSLKIQRWKHGRSGQ